MKKKNQSTQDERIKQAIRQRQEEGKQALRQAILEAAGELFVAQGYTHFSLRKVAEKIGYSPTTIYLYFKDKDDLLFTLVDEGFARFRANLERAVAETEDPWERLFALGRAYVRFGLQNQVYYQLMFMQRSDFLMDSRLDDSQPRIESFAVLQQNVQYALDAGALRPGSAESYSDILWAMMHGIVSLSITIPLFDQARIEATIQASRQLIEHGLKNVP